MQATSAAEPSGVRSAIPRVAAEDSDDLKWALATAAALYAKHERNDAARWLRHASTLALQGRRDARALELLGAADQLQLHGRTDGAPLQAPPKRRPPSARPTLRPPPVWPPPADEERTTAFTRPPAPPPTPEPEAPGPPPEAKARAQAVDAAPQWLRALRVAVTAHPSGGLRMAPLQLEQCPPAGAALAVVLPLRAADAELLALLV